jgi:hypothetical protein
VPAGTHDWTATESASVDEIAGADSPEAVDGAVAAAEVVHGSETVTEAHSESGYSVTDSVDTVVTEGVAAGEEVETTPDTILASDLTPITIAEAEAPTLPNFPLVAEEEPASSKTTPSVDLTDMGEPELTTPVADIGAPGSVPVIVALGAEPEPISVVEPVPEISSAAPEEPVPAPSYIPPIVPVVEEAAVEPAVEAGEEAAPETLAELAGLATGAAVVGAAETAPAVEESVAAPSPEVAHAEEIEQTSHMLKRIRVTRQIKVNGQVVEETSAEELIEADADPEPVRQRLREQLHRQATARMAELGVTPDQEEA